MNFCANFRASIALRRKVCYNRNKGRYFGYGKRRKKPAAGKAANGKTQQTAAELPAEEKKEAARNYHIAKRPDGKWQVKFAGGEKAIKLFSTQAEAIEYAKKLAKNQEGSISIHKKDGKLRKQKY